MDPTTSANYDQFSVQHTDFNWGISFLDKRLFGKVDLRVKAVAATHGNIVKLDSHTSLVYVEILINDSHSASFKRTPFSGFGECLEITLPEGIAQDETFRITVWYYTTQFAPSLTWLDALQTADKQHPLLFSQGQAVLNRSLFPCQDSPSCRMSWSSNLFVPAPYNVVMSGTRVNETAVSVEESQVPWHAKFGARLPSGTSWLRSEYKMVNSVPPYLIALVAGDLHPRRIGVRSFVWAEGSLADKAQFEFGHNNVTELYLQAGEQMFGPYLWGTYDVVVLPPSFPFGGMENPQATFVSPALLTGTQALVDVVAHEIMHSWSGNLCTNASWCEFFLNEGFTMYGQRRITTKVGGWSLTSVEIASGRELLRQTIEDYGKDAPLTRLVVPLGPGVDPDETYTDVPYEKGFAFVTYLAACVGGYEVLDTWLNQYFTTFAFKSLSSVEMLESFFTFFPKLKGDWCKATWVAEVEVEGPKYWAEGIAAPKNAEEMEKCSVLPALPDEIVGLNGKKGLAYRPGYEFARWFHQPGWPVYFPSTKDAEVITTPAEALANAFLAKAPGSDAATLFNGWHSYGQMHFLDTLLNIARQGEFAHAVLDLIDAELNLSKATNCEVRMRWCLLCAVAVYPKGYGSIANFLESTGKLKYVTPLYRELVNSPEVKGMGRVGRSVALEVYRRCRPMYHQCSQSRVDGIFEKAELSWNE